MTVIYGMSDRVEGGKVHRKEQMMRGIQKQELRTESRVGVENQDVKMKTHRRKDEACIQ